jgi:hypothetical protein
VRLEGLVKLKKTNSSGLEPATFRLVAYCLNHLRFGVPGQIFKGKEYVGNVLIDFV